MLLNASPGAIAIDAIHRDEVGFAVEPGQTNRSAIGERNTHPLEGGIG
jgi:hypothetical protein